MRRNAIRSLVYLLVLFLLLGSAGCQSGGAVAPAGGAPAPSRTPFQALPPTTSVGRPAAERLPTRAVPTDPTAPASAPTLGAGAQAAVAPEPCRETAGRFEAREIAFRAGEPPLVFRVYLPPCFDAEAASARYPVLYLIHGQTFAEDQWERLGIGAAADALIQSGEAPPFLIVLPREADTFADIYLSSFRQDVTEGLIPWIDASYPTCAERACRAIGGLSRGGAWAIHLGFSRWDLFGAIGAHSTPPFNTDPRLLPGWLAQIPEGQMPRIYMDAGRRDPYLSMASAFEQQLTEYGVAHEWYLFNGQHDEEYWAAHAADYLAWYTRPWASAVGK